ncbi:hypothetical protein HII17_09220 [Thalassotalea sp. M1531]|uniref:Uncharacterized protein n=1 Tax=Thalassotalea algicola TaxID=2716224 RepID=A0A7Y0Q7C4_9GAMM|nr:hypothetical protein [Thalassotalea algicola]NMP31742.1 hypothetical protein [Thalassotalea algicola]
MSEKYFNRISVYLVVAVLCFELGHLAWEYFNGGVVTHHIMMRADLPGISNWWGLVILPLLTWLSTRLVKKRITFQSNETSSDAKIPPAIIAAFLGMLAVSAVQSLAFIMGYGIITKYLALSVLIVGLFLPIYRPEYILGHVLGSAFTFGPLIPFIGVAIFSTVSVLANLVIKPIVLRIIERKAVSA